MYIDKCKVMSLTKFSSPIISDYTMDYIVLQHVFEICDLDVTFASSFSFNTHYLNFLKKTSTIILEFINRTYKILLIPMT